MFADWIFKESYQHIFQHDEACKAADDKIRAMDKKQGEHDVLLKMMERDYLMGECNRNELSEEDRDYYDHRREIVKEYYSAKLEAYQVAIPCLKKHMQTLSVNSDKEELNKCTRLEAEFDEAIIRYSVELMDM